MPLKPIKNSKPYYDDWNEAKNFLQILFRPGYAVQARELNQLQTILQNQIGSFADKIFKNGTPIFGAKIDIDFNYEYIEANPFSYEVLYPGANGFQGWTAQDTTLFVGLDIYTKDSQNNIIKYGKIQAVNGNRLYIKYYANRFDVGQTAYIDIVDQANNTTTTYRFSIANVGKGIAASITDGIFYVNRRFVIVKAQENIIIDPTNNNGSYVIGLEILPQDVITELDDPSLYENAQGTPNYAAPGAHRLTQRLILKGYDTQTFEQNRPANFYPQVWISGGKIVLDKNSVQYADLLDLLASRTYDESGNYTVEDFKVSINDDPTNQDQLIAEIGEGKAYVYGYQVENIVPVHLTFSKARGATHTQTSNTELFYVNYGIYIDIATDPNGIPEIHGIFDANKMEEVFICNTTLTPGATITPANLIKDALGNYVKFKVIAVGRNQFGELRIWLGDWQGKLDYLSSAKSIVSGTINTATNTFTINKWANFENYNGKIKIGRGSNETFIIPIAQDNIRVKNIVQGSVVFYSTKIYQNVAVTANQATISTPSAAESFNQDAVLLVVDSDPASANFGQPISQATYSVSISPDGKTITISATAGNTLPAQIDVLVKDIQKGNTITPRQKSITTITETLTSDANGVVVLSNEDVISVKSIVDTTNNQNIPVDSIRLDNGQRDYYYDKGRIFGLAPNTQYSITYDYYVHTGTGYFFSAESYPNQDNIPTYKNELQSFDLRNCIDFRRKLSEIQANGYDIILPNSDFICQYDFYVGRIDTIYIDTEGNFNILQGAPSKAPIAPELPEKTMPIANLHIKPWTINKDEVDIEILTTNRYTFEEIKNLEKRLKNIEYYVGLNALETDALNKHITDITGNTLDKKGIFVDNLTTYNNSDIDHKEFFGAIDQEKSTFRGDFKTTHFDLLPNNATMNNAQLVFHKHSITLPYTTKPYVEALKFTHDISVNPFAVYSWHGQVKLYPESDHWFETRYLPTIYRNIGTPIQRRTFFFYGAWRNIWRGTRKISDVATSGWYWRINGVWELVQDRRATYRTTIGQARLVQQLSIIPTQRRIVRDRFVASYAIPYMRARWIRFHATNMRPGIPLKAYFDGQDVSRYCWGLWTNSKGEAWGWFYLPPYRFRVGRRLFKLVDAIDGEDSSSAETYYTAQGTLIYRQKSITTIYGSRIVRNSYWQYRTISYTWNRDYSVVWRDPLAQSFLINTPNKTGIFVKSIDLFFAEKDPTLPITIYIATVENGIPTQHIVPGSEVTLDPSQVNVGAPSFGNLPPATRFEFDDPVYLEEGHEYAIVVFSNSNKYRLWVGTIGERDIVSGRGVYKNPYAGVMFKSQNSSTWTPEQNTDLAFRINQCVFDTTAMPSIVFDNGLYELHYDAWDANGNDTRIDINVGDVLRTTDGSASAYVVSHSLAAIDLPSTTIANKFEEGEIITASPSGAQAVVVRASTTKPRLYITRDGVNNTIPFQAGDTITGQTSGAITTITSKEYYVIVVHGKQGIFADPANNISKQLQNYGVAITNEKFIYNTTNAISANVSVDYLEFPNTSAKMQIITPAGTYDYQNKEDIDFGQKITFDNNNLISVSLQISTNDANVSPVVHRTRGSALLIDNNVKKFIYIPQANASSLTIGTKIEQAATGAYGFVDGVDHYYKKIGNVDYARVVLHNTNNIAFDGSVLNIGVSPALVYGTNQYEGYIYGTYISKTVNLEQDATDLRVYVNADLPANTNIEVYYTNENISSYKKLIVSGNDVDPNRLPSWGNASDAFYQANKNIIGTQSHVYQIPANSVAGTATTGNYTITDLNCVLIPTRLQNDEIIVQNVSNEGAFGNTTTANNIILVSSIPLQAGALLYDWNLNGIDNGGTAFPVGSYVIYKGMIWKVVSANNLGVVPSLINQSVYKLIPSFFATDTMSKTESITWKGMETPTLQTATGMIEYEFIPKEVIVDKFRSFAIKINLVGYVDYLTPSFADVRAIAAG